MITGFSGRAVRNLMEMIRRTGRQYESFRRKNRYDTPLLIFFLDMALSLVKLTLIAGAILALWFISNRIFSLTGTGLSAEATVAEPTIVDNRAVKVQSSSNPAEQDSAARSRELAIARNGTSSSSIKQNSSLADSNIVDEAWVQDLDPASYLIQFGTSADLELFDEFVPNINNGEPIAIYPFKQTPTGRPVYGIATGVYDDLDLALAAIEGFSPQARAYEPWVRKVSDLNDDIASVQSKAPAQ